MPRSVVIAGLLALLAAGLASPGTAAEPADVVAEPPYRHIDERGYRDRRYRAPTPADTPHATTLGTAALARLVDGAARLALVDVQAVAVRPETELFGIDWLPSEPRFNLPGSTWLPNVGYPRLDDRMDAYFRRELERITGGDRGHPVVLYCVHDCWMSWNAVRRAAAYGYTRLYWYRDGTDGWEDAGRRLEEATPVPLTERP